MDSVSVTKSIRVSPEMAALMDNLIAAGEFSTTSELILEALAQFLEHHELGPSTRILRIKVHAEVERRLQALADAGDGPTVEDAAVKVLREHVKDRAKALVEDSAEFDRLAEKLQKRSLDAVAENARGPVVSK
jgi:Arc/MetJ-type ribon-helix-helix transcriptional regulator